MDIENIKRHFLWKIYFKKGFQFNGVIKGFESIRKSFNREYAKLLQNYFLLFIYKHKISSHAYSVYVFLSHSLKLIIFILTITLKIIKYYKKNYLFCFIWKDCPIVSHLFQLISAASYSIPATVPLNAIENVLNENLRSNHPPPSPHSLADRATSLILGLDGLEIREKLLSSTLPYTNHIIHYV